MTGGTSSSPRQKNAAAATTIAPGAYPTFTAADAVRLSLALRDPATTAKAARIIASKADELRIAVLTHVDRLEAAARLSDLDTVFEQAHEIRGLAGNAGLIATGRIANVLCKYLDTIDRAGGKPERSVVVLHLEAITRAAQAEDEATRLGDAVADELALLVEKRLSEINVSATG
ncbi:MAG: Hpt domain-containing protein [Alphaproteobacteria bacterium]|nr:Hpt domain-containing protein [Alphaproteobacteria bacterium]MDE2109988.1 Hpt domain-containing protein [Alphaproteobacteria bacterium]MDE2495155.1 Hpt domain-containing protein [Alphaproteobacteria bacterium]